VWQNTEHYTPPINVRKMTKDLAFLPAWYAEKEDYVFVDDGETPDATFLSDLPETIRPSALPLTRNDLVKNAAILPHMEVRPWGISRPVICLFNELKQSYGLPLDLPLWKQEYSRLTNRRTAAECLDMLREILPDTPLPPTPRFFSEIEEIETFMQRHSGNFVLKAPYSSSGRGLLWTNGNRLNDNERKRIGKILRTQGAISMEQVADKIQDFAMEYHSDGKGNIRYEGLSLFHTTPQGAYKGNTLQTQSALREKLQTYVGKETTEPIRQAVTQALVQTFATRYTGYIGVDMLLYKGKEAFDIHPCIEINLRYTMGLAALRIFANYLEANATGVLNILYEKETKRAYERHRQLKKTYPIVHKNGKLSKGYLSLCPVREHTQFVAYILAT
jgi:hypothetical protein